MMPLPLLILLLRLPAARAAGTDPRPTPWPTQFHAKILMDYHGNLSLADLWYDWPGGRNLHVIRYQLAADAPYYDAEWNNGTSFFYTPARRSCRSAAVGVGILRPDWLAPGAVYLGRRPADGFDCHAWAKADFITYYEDVRTKRPVKWVFYTGIFVFFRFAISQAPEILQNHSRICSPLYSTWRFVLRPAVLHEHWPYQSRGKKLQGLSSCFSFLLKGFTYLHNKLG